jgi:Tfp pilus assembly protein PilX
MGLLEGLRREGGGENGEGAPNIEQGTILLPVLALLLLVSLLLLTGTQVLTQRARIDQLSSGGRSAYWLARSAATKALRQVEGGQPPPAVESLTLPGGTVTIQCTSQTIGASVLWNIRVTAHSAGYVDTVSVEYNATVRKVTNWQDNVAGS